MTANDKTNFSPARPLILSPWLVVVAAMLLYGLTLNHWVTLKSLPVVAQVTGWDWQPYPLEWRSEAMAPLFLVLSAPVRILPVAWQPLALNLLTAVWAALTLGLLARSVRLLAHDRTKEQRMREGGEHALLSFRAAFLPPLFAVLVLATHQIFWQNAIVATGEMLNVLVFAFVINCLLEFRISRNDKWLLVSAFVYGAGASNNWALLGFFPMYLIAVLWVKGLAGFITTRFLTRMFAAGVAGLMLYLLIPLLASVRNGSESFFNLLHLELGNQSYGLKLIPRWMGLVAAVPTVLPLVFASIKWPTLEGEVSAAGDKLTRFLFAMLHVAFLGLTLVTFFDFKYSPSVHMREMPVSFLTFYYMGALSIGYFSGYMLLAFGKTRVMKWERPHPLLTFAYGALYGLAWVVAFAAPALLAWQSLPHILAGNGNALQQFADETLDCLPSKKSIVLSDDAARLYLLQAECERRGLPNPHFLIETESFPHKKYIAHLVSHYPDLRSVMTTNISLLPEVLGSGNLMQFMYHVTQNFPVYYLHPSFGYYFEALYLKPSGLIYELKPYTTNMTQPPLVTQAEVRTNEAFWAKLENGPLKTLPAMAKLDFEAEAVSVDYSVALDFWGTDLQKANYLKEAQHNFAAAVRLDPDNFVAAINLEYNGQLQKGQRAPIDSKDAFIKAMYSYHGLVPLLRRNGPPDEPGLDLQIGAAFAEGGNLRQAANLFERRIQLLPDDPDAQLAMARTDVDLRQPEKALELVHKLRNSTKVNKWQLDRCEALAFMAEGNFSTAERVLRDAIQADPKDENRVATMAEFYKLQGVELSRQRKNTEAARAFTNALSSLDHELQMVASSSRETATSTDVPDTLLKKAEIQVMLRSYTAAVATLSQALELQPKNYTALMNRAVAEVQLKQFQAAKDDFKEMGKILPQQKYLVEFGLAEVAAAQSDQAEEIDHLKRGIKSAPKESNDYQRATNRLAKLEHK